MTHFELHDDYVCRLTRVSDEQVMFVCTVEDGRMSDTNHRPEGPFYTVQLA